ncbi:MAG: hypothetical protein KJO50_10675 [Bacteroidia bacterium]|nr:hypothetical protein [Bacteroidia bacterium]
MFSFDANNELEGLLVYHIRKYRGFTWILMPVLTAYGGIYLNYPEDLKSHSRISYENRIIPKLVSQLPSHSFYYQQYSTDFKNWLPLKWLQYQQSTRYTYKISLDNNIDSLRSSLKGNTRRNISNAEKECTVSSISFEEYWFHLVNSYKERGKTNPFNQFALQNLYNSLTPLGKCDLLSISNTQTQEVLGGIFIVKDHLRCYYLSGFYYPKGEPKHSFSALLWHVIAQCKLKEFDFEGSMIPDIEKFFRSFGGELIPHYKIWKINSLILRLLFSIKKPSFLG